MIALICFFVNRVIVLF